MVVNFEGLILKKSGAKRPHYFSFHKIIENFLDMKIDQHTI